MSQSSLRCVQDSDLLFIRLVTVTEWKRKEEEKGVVTVTGGLTMTFTSRGELRQCTEEGMGKFQVALMCETTQVTETTRDNYCPRSRRTVYHQL